MVKHSVFASLLLAGLFWSCNTVEPKGPSDDSEIENPTDTIPTDSIPTDTSSTDSVPADTSSNPIEEVSFFSADTATWPKLYVGASYRLRLGTGPSSHCVVENPAPGSGIDFDYQYDLNTPASTFYLAVTPTAALAGTSKHTFVVKCGEVRDTAEYFLRVFYATGFAPIESSLVRVYRQTYASACGAYLGGTWNDTIDHVLTPLGPTGEGFRFELKKAGNRRKRFSYPARPDSVVPVLQFDTLEFRKFGNAVQRKSSGIWTTVTSMQFFQYDQETLPYFFQDTLFTRLGVDGDPLSGSLGTSANRYTSSYAWWGKYQSGLGLTEMESAGFPAICGADRFKVMLLDSYPKPP